MAALAAAPTAAGAASWAVQSTPNPVGTVDSGLVGVSCSSASACTAVGEYSTSTADEALAESWDGTSWVIQPTPSVPNGGLAAVSCTSPSACTAVGPLPSGGGNLPLIERWDGTSWSVQPTPTTNNGYLDAVSCASTSFCTAVGSRATVDGNSEALVEFWNGTGWAIHYSPSPISASQSVLTGVSCTSATSCTAVGYYDHFSYTDALPWAEHWNGISWTMQPVPVPAGTAGTGYSFLNGVSCTSSLTASACTAVGFYVANCSPTGPPGCGMTVLVERRTGTSWVIQRAPNTSVGFQSSVSCASANSCEAVFDGPVAEGWDGVSWSIQPTPTPDGSYLLGVSCTSSAACTAVGGNFSTALVERYS